jgi:hypothetical protein
MNRGGPLKGTEWRRVVWAATAWVAVLALVVGVPVISLSLGAGVPRSVPTSWKGISDVLRRPLPDAFVGQLLVLVLGLVWLWLVVLVALEFSSALRGGTGPRPAAGRIGRRWVAELVGCALLIVGPTAEVAGASPPLPVSAPVTFVTGRASTPFASAARTDGAPSAEPSSPSPAATGQGPKVVTTRAGDTLWGLAVAHLGAGRRSSEIWALNEGRTMADGRTFARPSLLGVGWKLFMPPDAIGTEPSDVPAGPVAKSPSSPVSTHVVLPGESEWSIAAAQVNGTNQSAGPDAVAAYWKEFEQRNGGRAANPDRIFPGEILEMPPRNSPATIDSDASAPPVDEPVDRGAPPPAPTAAPSPIGSPSPQTPAAAEAVPAPPGEAASSHPPGSIPPISPPVLLPAGSVPPARPGPGHRPARVAPGPGTVPTHRPAAGPGGPGGHHGADSWPWATAVELSGLAVAGLTAAGVAARLRRLRRVQVKTRQPGRAVRQPASEVAALELRVDRRAAAEDPVADALDEAMRALSAGVADWAEMPVVVAAQVSGDGAVDIQLGAPLATAPPGFDSVNPFMWRTSATAADLLQLGAAATNPSPCLITVGSSTSGPVLIDLEAAGMLSVEGPEEQVAGVLRSVALQLATASEQYAMQLRLVGVAEALTVLDATEAIGVDELLAEITVAARHTSGSANDSLRSSAFALRARSGGMELWPPTVGVVTGATPTELASLAEVAVPWSGAAVIAAGPVPGCRWRLVLGADTATLEMLGLAMRAPQTDDVAALIEILAARSDTAGVEVPPEPGPPHLAPLDWPSVQGEDGVDDWEPAPAGGCLADDAASVGSGSAAIAASAAGPDVAAVAPPHVRILGSRPRVEGWAIDPEPKLGPVEETVVLLATLARQAGAAEIYEYIWSRRVWATESDTQTPARVVSVGMSRARRCLGRDAADDAYLTLATRSNRGEKGYRLQGVGSDWADFTALVAAADAADDTVETVALLVEALSLVDGVPFSVCTPVGSYDWAPLVPEALPTIQRRVSDAAHQLTSLAMRAGDAGRARWAVRKGLTACPPDETLWIDLATLAEQASDDSEIRSIHDQAATACGGLSAATEEWFAACVARRRQMQQWRAGGPALLQQAVPTSANEA